MGSGHPLNCLLSFSKNGLYIICVVIEYIQSWNEQDFIWSLFSVHCCHLPHTELLSWLRLLNEVGPYWRAGRHSYLIQKSPSLEGLSPCKKHLCTSLVPCHLWQHSQGKGNNVLYIILIFSCSTWKKNTSFSFAFVSNPFCFTSLKMCSN